MPDMSQVNPTTRDQSKSLDPAVRAWLDERLREYRELLAYLRDH